jgi:hypothetical protein
MILSFLTGINSHNGIITINSYDNKPTSKYFSIFDNQLHQIGEKDDQRLTSFTYFFPAHNKMIVDAASGIWIYDIDYASGVGKDIVETPYTLETPYMVSLLSNYPNPFNPETTITFSVGNTFMRSDGTDKSVPYSVRIDIYNTKGQRVRSLVDGYYGVGEHKVVWNGADDKGVAVGSGVYFYRMKAGEYMETRKMILLK